MLGLEEQLHRPLEVKVVDDCSVSIGYDKIHVGLWHRSSLLGELGKFTTNLDAVATTSVE